MGCNVSDAKANRLSFWGCRTCSRPLSPPPVCVTPASQVCLQPPADCAPPPRLILAAGGHMALGMGTRLGQPPCPMPFAQPGASNAHSMVPRRPRRLQLAQPATGHVEELPPLPNQQLGLGCDSNMGPVGRVGRGFSSWVVCGPGALEESGLRCWGCSHGKGLGPTELSLRPPSLNHLRLVVPLLTQLCCGRLWDPLPLVVM